MQTAVSPQASSLDPLGRNPEERARRIAAIRQRRYREGPDSDTNILLFAYDEAVAEREALAEQLASKSEVVGVEGDPRDAGDDLDAFITQRSVRNPGFAGLLRRASRRRRTRAKREFKAL